MASFQAPNENIILDDYAAAPAPEAPEKVETKTRTKKETKTKTKKETKLVIKDEKEKEKEEKEEEETDCFCCCEPYNKSTRARIRCDNPACDYESCKTCVRNYLVSSPSDPHCMSCKKAWSQRFMIANLNQTWVNGAYKEHRTKLLTDYQISKLPESMAAAALYSKKEEIQKQADAVKIKLEEAEKAAAVIRDQHIALLREIYEIEHGKPNEKKEVKFMMPCPVDDCRGLLSTAYKCEICKTYACSKCLIPTGAIRDDPNHTCNKEDVDSAQLIKDSTKPCPGCGERIFKISGCDQMWCVKCHTTFSWRTLSIITNAVVHNPHYYEWQRKNGTNGNALRNPGDVVCGGLPAYYTLTRAFRTIYANNNKDKDYKSLEQFYMRLHQFASHISYYDLDRERTRVRTCSDFQKERVLYINKIIDREELGKRIIQKDRNRKRAIDKVHLYEMIDAVLIDLVAYIINIKDHENAVEILREKREEMKTFAVFCNKQFQELSAIQNCKVPQIVPESWYFTSQKFSTKQIGL